VVSVPLEISFQSRHPEGGQRTALGKLLLMSACKAWQCCNGSVLLVGSGGHLFLVWLQAAGWWGMAWFGLVWFWF